MSDASSVASASRDRSLRAYEELRERVLSGSSRSGHTGLVVLMREGVRAWLARPHESYLPRRSLANESTAAITTFDELQPSLVRVLANIAVAHTLREEINA